MKNAKYKSVRRITASKKDLIRRLTDIIYPFLPLSARSKSTITFKSIFGESNIEKYLEGHENKKQALQQGFENLFRYNQKLPYTIIRKIVPAAIEYRRFKRNPLKQDELNSLIRVLEELGIMMGPELRKIELDETVPDIQVPPNELVKRLENHPLVEEISSEPLSLFKNGHFNEAVRKSAERFEKKVQDITRSSDIGKNLMSRIFNISSHVISLNSLSNDNEKGIQEGYMYMTMGMIRAIRNVFSHGDEDQRSPEECYEMLLFLNWLFRLLNTRN